MVALPQREENDDEAEGVTPFGDDAAALEVEAAGQENGEGGGDFPGVLFIKFQQLFREAGAAIEGGFERGHGDGGEYGAHGRAKDQGAAAVAEADEGEHDGEDGEADLEFAIFVKDSGRDDGDEQTAERAAGRDEEKIGSQVARRRLELVELAVADHADDEERAGVAGDLEFHRGIAAGVEQADEAGDTDDEQGGENSAVIPTSVVEADYEREQVEREREHPQKRDDGDLLAKFVGDREEQDRGECREGDPECLVVPSRVGGGGLRVEGGGLRAERRIS